MFTTGSKLFIGATVLSVVSALLFAVCVDGEASAVGTIGMLSASAVFAFLAGINLFVRDTNAPAMQPGIEYTANAARRPVRNTGWPLIAALGVAGLAIGAVSKPVVFKAALVVVLAALIEWTVSAWSERASDDDHYNGGIRSRVLNPLEFPVVAAVGLAAIIYAFSRVMLSVDKSAGRVVFIAIGALLLAGAFIIAGRRGAARRTVATVCTVGAFALVGVGVASAVSGQRHIEEHETAMSDPATLCLEGVEEEHLDKGSPGAPSASASVFATIVAQADGSLVAVPSGANLASGSSLTVSRGAQITVLFRNDTDEAQRLTARLGKVGDAEEIVSCTAGVEPGEEGFLSFKATVVQGASTEPLALQLGGDETASVELLVP